MKNSKYAVAALVVSVLLLGPSEELLAQVEVVPVQIINPPDLPVPVIRTDDLPIPPELLNFQRQYCSRWQRPRLVDENGERRLVEYRARIPTIDFPNHAFWIGELLGTLVGTEEHLSIGWQGAVEVTSACAISVPPGFALTFIPNLNPRTKNLYTVSDEIQGYACVFDDQFPVDVLVRARLLEYKGLQNDLVSAGSDGDGRVCLNLTFIGPVGAD